ncbi:aldo/keto reductase [Halogeometricum limi]|uniref:Aldo/keto reductase n=1 Tax=Halogeometricum limi TaxID=555875 RepID=A0A1I6G046_9EURY|nr:aldo/keto reductase [Halogeometricum limi]SFR35565.1 Aldo/keto reductase [Halogeometricum limi]
MSTEEIPTVDVRGVRIPKVGLGTWKMDGEECYDAVSTALELGYRHVDTAQMYGNESDVGRAIADADVDRSDVFLTTKVNPRNADYEGVVESTKASLDRLDTPYVDLLLLHWPNPLVGIERTMRGMKALVDEGRVYNVGVSNFPVSMLERAREVADVPILTDQVQFHPFRPQRKLLRYCQDEDVVLTGYSPLAHGDVLDDETLREVGERYDKSPAQVALRWATQHRNVAVVPKSTSRDHLADNLAIFDFKLTREEVDEVTRPSLLKTGASMVRGMLD